MKSINSADAGATSTASHPSRVCGLKLCGGGMTDWRDDVTPLAGVWIEILSFSADILHSQSHPSRVCGLK